MLIDTYPEIAGLAAALFIEMGLLWKLGDEVSGKLLSASQRGFKPFWYFLMAPGVIIHEVSHALCALTLGVKIKKFVPFKPQQQKDGSFVLGYVQPGPATEGQNALISLAPLWLTPFILFGLAFLCFDNLGSYDPLPLAPLEALVSDLASPLSWLWLYVFISASLSNFPSSGDIANVKPILPIITLLLILPFIAAVITLTTAATILAPYYLAVLLLAPSAFTCLVIYVVISNGSK